MKPLLKYCLYFLISFTIAGMSVYFSISLVTDSAGEVILPELKGKNIIYVLETLTNMGLNTKLLGTDYDDALPRYHVISQDPEPGSVIKKGRDVLIYISRGKQEMVIPDLRHLSLERAELILAQYEFQKGAVSFAHSNTVMKNNVMAQYPLALSTNFKGLSCDLLISLGPRPDEYIMPDITGRTLPWAVSILEENNLKLEKVTSDYSTRYDENLILNQQPEPGRFVDLNDSISIVVNTRMLSDSFTINDFQGVIPVSYHIDPGFLNKNVKINTTMFGLTIDLFSGHVAPGNEVCVLIPAGIQTTVDIFIDDELIQSRHINPWNKTENIGELLWE